MSLHIGQIKSFQILPFAHYTGIIGPKESHATTRSNKVRLFFQSHPYIYTHAHSKPTIKGITTYLLRGVGSELRSSKRHSGAHRDTFESSKKREIPRGNVTKKKYYRIWIIYNSDLPSTVQQLATYTHSIYFLNSTF